MVKRTKFFKNCNLNFRCLSFFIKNHYF